MFVLLTVEWVMHVVISQPSMLLLLPSQAHTHTCTIIHHALMVLLLSYIHQDYMPCNEIQFRIFLRPHPALFTAVLLSPCCGLNDVVMYEGWHTWHRRWLNVQRSLYLRANVSPPPTLLSSCMLSFFPISFQLYWILLCLTTTVPLYFPVFFSFFTHA